MVAQHSLPPLPVPAWCVYCLSAQAERDELAGAMLAQLLQQQGFEAQRTRRNSLSVSWLNCR
jgi:hypothetical protein